MSDHEHDDLPDLMDNPPAIETKTNDKTDKKSNYYFFKSTPAEEQHKYAPKPIEQPAQTAPQPVKDAGPSTWNAAVCTLQAVHAAE